MRIGYILVLIYGVFCTIAIGLSGFPISLELWEQGGLKFLGVLAFIICQLLAAGFFYLLTIFLAWIGG